MLLANETIDHGFRPVLSKLPLAFREQQYLEDWHIGLVAQPAPTFADSGLRAALWMPSKEVFGAEYICEVPVLALSVPVEQKRKPKRDDLVWYAGSLPLATCVRYEPRDMELIRYGIESANIGAATLQEILEYLQNSVPMVLDSEYMETLPVRWGPSLLREDDS